MLEVHFLRELLTRCRRAASVGNVIREGGWLTEGSASRSTSGALELIPLNSSLQFNSGLIQVWLFGRISLGYPVAYSLCYRNKRYHRLEISFF